MWQRNAEFTDIAIDHNQPVREALELLNYVPNFPGFYTMFKGYELNGYLERHYDNPKVQNKSFYGTLHKVLRTSLGAQYENVLILLVKDEHVLQLRRSG